MRWIVGLQPVREAIRAHGKNLGRVLVEQCESPQLDAVARFATDQGAKVERVSRAELENTVPAEASYSYGDGTGLVWVPAVTLTQAELRIKREP